MNFFGDFCLFPLILGPLEQVFVVISFVAYFYVYGKNVEISWAQKMYLAGAVGVYFVFVMADYIIKANSFLPLLVMSV